MRKPSKIKDKDQNKQDGAVGTCRACRGHEGTRQLPNTIIKTLTDIRRSCIHEKGHLENKELVEIKNMTVENSKNQKS